jgi:putative glycosyltransferase (TIGR04372 family)
MKIKIFLRKIILFFFKFIINFSIYRFDKTKYKNYIISCPAVNTFGDPIQHIDHIRLINIQSKKKHLIICPNIFPINVHLRFFLEKKLYEFYSEKVYLFFNYILVFFKKITDLPHFYNHLLLSGFNRKISDFNYYKNYSKINDKILLKAKKNYSQKFINAYLDARNNNNKLDSLKIRNDLKNKFGHLILRNCPGFNINEFKSLIKNLKIKREYVCLHIRNNYDQNEPRSVNDLESYFPMINFLKRRFDIVLLGTNKDNNFTNQFLEEGIINYKFSKYQSPLNDILLISNCKIYFGNFSGPQAIAYSFGKPMMLFDGWPIYSFYYNYKNFKIFPKFIFNNNKIVRMNELLNSENYFQEHLKSPYRLVCSSGEDKLKEVKLFLKKFDKKIFSVTNKKKIFFRNLLNPIHLGPYYSYNAFCDTYLKKTIY